MRRFAYNDFRNAVIRVYSARNPHAGYRIYSKSKKWCSISTLQIYQIEGSIGMLKSHVNKDILICRQVKFYARKDEAAFFEWITAIECIDHTSAAGDELYLHIASSKLHDQDLRDLLALFFRYQIGMRQLSRYLCEENRRWFYENKQAYWHKNVFGSD